MTSRIALLLVLLALSGCASGPPTAPTAPETPVAVPPAAPPAVAPPTAAEQRTAAASTLAVERQWLAAWFKGTGVVIAQHPSGAVTVDVPREFCFDAGKDAVKPPLAAVLDKVAQSMRRTSIAQLHLIAAPGDAGATSATLAVRRATRVSDFLRAHGVAESRLARPSATGGTAVQLRIEAAPPA